MPMDLAARDTFSFSAIDVSVRVHVDVHVLHVSYLVYDVLPASAVVLVICAILFFPIYYRYTIRDYFGNVFCGIEIMHVLYRKILMKVDISRSSIWR